MQNEYQIGDTVYLKQPELGYRCVEITGVNPYGRYIVVTTSGYEFTVQAAEIEELI